MMKTKKFIAKITASIFLALAGTTALFCQLQTATISGIISDMEGNPIKDVAISVWFNKSLISEGQSDSHGYYTIDILNYGGIQTMSMQVTDKEHYLDKKSESIDFSNSLIEKDIAMQIGRQLHREDVIVYEYRTLVSNSFASTSGNMFRLPTGTFAYNKPGLYDPVYYYENISSKFSIVDIGGKSIANARVEIKVPDDKARWGITDENGELMMHMQFEKGARNGKITVTADGFRTKKMPGRIFYPNNKNTIKLHAVK